MNTWIIVAIIIVVLLIVLMTSLYLKKRKEKKERKKLDDVSRLVRDMKERLHDVRYRTPKNIKVDLEDKDRI